MRGFGVAIRGVGAVFENAAANETSLQMTTREVRLKMKEYARNEVLLQTTRNEARLQ